VRTSSKGNALELDNERASGAPVELECAKGSHCSLQPADCVRRQGRRAPPRLKAGLTHALTCCFLFLLLWPSGAFSPAAILGSRSGGAHTAWPESGRLRKVGHTSSAKSSPERQFEAASGFPQLRACLLARGSRKKALLSLSLCGFSSCGVILIFPNSLYAQQNTQKPESEKRESTQ